MGREDGVEKTPAWAAEISGVPAATIERLAREYATTKPAALMDCQGPARSAMGEQYNRCAVHPVRHDRQCGPSGRQCRRRADGDSGRSHVSHVSHSAGQEPSGNRRPQGKRDPRHPAAGGQAGAHQQNLRCHP